jgi:phosphohistidine phosphatase
MGDDDDNNNYTTNEEDQREAARLKERLQQVTASEDEPDKTKDSSTSSTAPCILPNVEIAEGAHKYVLISAMTPAGDQRQHFVVSKRGAHYHRNAAEPFVDRLEQSGYKSIDITGGGRIALDSSNQTIAVYGYSYGFGLADHALSKAVILSDPRYKDFEVTWSNEGY